MPVTVEQTVAVILEALREDEELNRLVRRVRKEQGDAAGMLLASFAAAYQQFMADHKINP